MILHLTDCPPRRWKNGLGQTREIAVQPSADGSTGFLWRVSIAEVTSAAPFSAFPGVDRVIALLEGAGFRMTLDAGHVHALTTPFAPFAFPGEATVEVQLADGPTRDFNLMVRRALARGELQVWREPAAHVPDPTVVLVYCAHGVIDTVDGTLHAGDAWQPAGSRAGEITVHPDTVALVARVVPHAT
jgi:environmental stress-induced protein Ves